MNSNVKLNYTSTLEGSVLVLTCEKEISNIMKTTDEQVLIATCYSSGSWTPDPSEFACLIFTTSKQQGTINQ